MSFPSPRSLFRQDHQEPLNASRIRNLLSFHSQPSGTEITLDTSKGTCHVRGGEERTSSGAPPPLLGLLSLPPSPSTRVGGHARDLELLQMPHGQTWPLSWPPARCMAEGAAREAASASRCPPFWGLCSLCNYLSCIAVSITHRGSVSTSRKAH